MDKVCFILLPGFAPDNVPVLKLKEALENLGFTAIASSFFGDDFTGDFSDLTMQLCQNHISTLIDNAAKKYRQVIGIGISLGGALLLEHAKIKNNLEGIVSIGTPCRLKLRPLMAMGEFLLPLFYPLWKKIDNKYKKLRLLPLGAAPIVIRFLENEFLQNLEKITTPVIFLQGQKDKVHDYQALPKFVEKISSRQKEVVYLENGNHVIDYDSEVIIKHALKFLN